jgi:hypothetical protein
VLLLYLPLYWYRKHVEDVRDGVEPAVETAAPTAEVAPGGAAP